MRGEPPPEWELPTHGTVDFDLYINLKIPIPTLLIPLAFARWVMVKLTNLVYPYLLTLNERFHDTPFSARVRDDEHGFYRRCGEAFTDPHRPHNRPTGGGGGASRGDDGPVPSSDACSGCSSGAGGEGVEPRPKFIFRTSG